MAHFFKNQPHIIRKMLFYNVRVGLRYSTGVNGTHIDRYKTIPKSEKVIRQQIDGFLTRVFCDGGFFLDNCKANQSFQVFRHDGSFFTNFHCDIVHSGSTICNRFYDCVIDGWLSEFLLQQISGLLVQITGTVKKMLQQSFIHTIYHVQFVNIERNSSGDSINQ